MKNEIRFTLESKQRPKLAQEIGNILGTAQHYERVPSCTYDIAGYRLDKEGVLLTPRNDIIGSSLKNLSVLLRRYNSVCLPKVVDIISVQSDI